MQRVWFATYNTIIVPALWAAIHLAGVFKRKIRRGIRGRKGLFPALQTQTSRIGPSTKRIWFHSSSLGEFEQAKPIIAELKRRRPDVAVFVSFFSPSGYDHSRRYKLADVITYIPFDSYRNARRFIDLLQPDAAIMLRYDVWPNHIWALRAAGVPTIIANATMKPTSARYLPLASNFHRAVYNSLDFILTVSEQDASAFHRFKLTRPVIAAIGDTRYDQVWQRSAESRTRHILPPDIVHAKKIFVVGSSWESDEEVLIPPLTAIVHDNPSVLTILVPHEPTLENIERIERELNGKLSSIRFSDLQDYNNENVIIIDSVGILMALYQYGHVAYVGGSFRNGVHNVLEPAVYGIPVLVGSRHANSQEAVQLVRQGGAFAAGSADELLQLVQTLLTDDAYCSAAGERAKRFVERNVGATERFLSYLEKVL